MTSAGLFSMPTMPPKLFNTQLQKEEICIKAGRCGNPRINDGQTPGNQAKVENSSPLALHNPAQTLGSLAGELHQVG